MRQYSWSATLERCPFSTPALVDAVMLPYRTDSDYEALQTFARSASCTPVLLGYAHYYGLLEAVVLRLRESLLPDGPVLLEMSRPLGIPVPRSLLAAGVLLCDEVESQARWWQDTAVSRFVMIRTRIRRDLHEFGDNSLSVRLFSRADTIDPLLPLMDALEFRKAFGACHGEDRLPSAPVVAMEEAV